MAARGRAMSRASAIMRVLKDGLISIFARCLSPAAGRGYTGLWALPLAGGRRWYGSAGGTIEGAGMRASSPYTRQSGSARSRMGSHLRLPVQLGSAADPPSRGPRVVPSRVPQSVCSSRQAVQVYAPIRLGSTSCLIVNGCLRSSGVARIGVFSELQDNAAVQEPSQPRRQTTSMPEIYRLAGHKDVTAALTLPKADIWCSIGLPASPRCCSRRRPQPPCQCSRTYRDLWAIPNLQLDLHCSENAQKRCYECACLCADWHVYSQP